MYHQIIEAMSMHPLEDCHFFIQLSVYTSLSILDKCYIKELKSLSPCSCLVTASVFVISVIILVRNK
ncbi:hypothetical protein SDC9_151106 [bioreactor metagenome]|uniref:Uncharacterized protein n=1 Tax=bioreactor metagenome TaxID=1076179 RepID=A0A645ERH9_9ZZZZ